MKPVSQSQNAATHRGNSSLSPNFRTDIHGQTDLGQTDLPIICGCSTEKVNAVHTYLRAQFPAYELRHFHTSRRVVQNGRPIACDEHHVIGVTHEGVLSYYAVLLNEFQEHSVTEIGTCLRRWNLAGALRASRVAIASRSGVAALFDIERPGDKSGEITEQVSATMAACSPEQTQTK